MDAVFDALPRARPAVGGPRIAIPGVTLHRPSFSAIFQPGDHLSKCIKDALSSAGFEPMSCHNPRLCSAHGAFLECLPIQALRVISVSLVISS